MTDEQFERFINRLKANLKIIASTEELIKEGLFSSLDNARMARKAGLSPYHLKIPGKGIGYPRDGVIIWLRGLRTSQKAIEPILLRQHQEEEEALMPQTQEIEPWISSEDLKKRYEKL